MSGAAIIGKSVVGDVDAEIRIEPLGITITIKPDESIMAAAERQGLKWPTLCRGNAQCGFCFVEVLNGAETLAAPTEREIRALKLSPKPASTKLVRLACQLRSTENLIVERNGVQRAVQSAPAKRNMEPKNADRC